jgi:hypothetical protein
MLKTRFLIYLKKTLINRRKLYLKRQTLTLYKTYKPLLKKEVL